MADFTTLLAGETAQDVAEAFDSGLTEREQDTADHVRCGKFENLIGKAHAASEQKTAAQRAAMEKAAKTGKGYFCVTGQHGSDLNNAVSLETDLSRLGRINTCLREKEHAEALSAVATKNAVQLSKDTNIACDALKNNSAYAANLKQTESNLSKMSIDGTNNDDEVDELQRLREARIAQLRREKMMTDKWKELGHGKLRLLPDEREFFKQVRPHERAVVVIHRKGDPNCCMEKTNFMSCLVIIAEKHIETAVFHMYEETAGFMLSMLDIPDGGLPILFILRHGEVICRISRSILLDSQLCVDGDSLKFERLLKSRDAFGEGLRKNGNDSGSGSDSGKDSESEEEENGRRKRLEFMR